MSRAGLTDSSVASGNCSMARNSQTAKGSVASRPEKPKGNSGPLPPGSSAPPGAMFNAQRWKPMFGMALIQKARTTSDRSVTTNVTLKESSRP